MKRFRPLAPLPQSAVPTALDHHTPTKRVHIDTPIWVVKARTGNDEEGPHVLALLAALGSWLLSTLAAAPLPRPAPFSGSLPPANPPDRSNVLAGFSQNGGNVDYVTSWSGVFIHQTADFGRAVRGPEREGLG